MNFSRLFAPPKDNYCSLDPIDFFVLYWYRKGFSHTPYIHFLLIRGSVPVTLTLLLTSCEYVVEGLSFLKTESGWNYTEKNCLQVLRLYL